MLLLAFDTTANSVSVALLNESGVLVSRFLEMTRGQGEALIPMIADILSLAGRQMKDVTDVAVSVGPGSFTGVRVGLAAARGIGLALGIPMHGVTTFEMAAYHLKRPLTVVLDTKRGDFYTQFFPSGRKKPESPCIQTAEEVKALAGYWTGNGVSLLGEDSRFIQNHVIPAEAVGLIAMSRLDHPLAVEPVYLREADVTV